MSKAMMVLALVSALVIAASLAGPSCNPDGFLRNSKGTCPPDSRFIENNAECEMAAKSLGLTSTTVQRFGFDKWGRLDRPHGCFFKAANPDGQELYVNPAGNKADDDTGRVSLCRCEEGWSSSTYAENIGYAGANGNDIGTCGIYTSQQAIEQFCNAEASCLGYSYSTTSWAMSNGGPWWCAKTSREVGDSDTDSTWYQKPAAGSGSGSVRLVDGLLQMDLGGSWKYVCDDRFDQNNNGANVACRELGFTSGTHSDGTAPVDSFYDEVNCAGTERALVDCPRGSGEDCLPSEAVKLTCRGLPDPNALIIKQVVTYEIEGTLSEMSEVDIRTTKDNIGGAFVSASNGAIAKDDIESIKLSQNGHAGSGRYRRRAAGIDVTITLKSTVGQSTATNAAAESVEFEVVVGGVATKVMQTATVTEIAVTPIATTCASCSARSQKRGKRVTGEL